MITSKYTIREKNEATVLQQIIVHQEISRTSLSQITNLNKATISSIINKLLEDELIVETRIGDSSKVGGRKPIFLKFNKYSSLALVIDIGIDYVEACLSYIDGTYIRTVREANIEIKHESIVQYLNTIIDQLLEHAPNTKLGILGLAIAIHGIVHNDEIEYTPNYSLDQIHLKTQLEKIYDFPIFIENEANLTALANYSFSAGINNLISISVHSGIGAGIIQDGNLVIGKHGRAGEIGHTIAIPDGKLCPCGNKGCLDQYASSTALYNKIAQAKTLDFVNLQRVIQLMNENDTKTIEIIKENAKYIAIGINNIVMMYDPEIVIINNPIYKKNPELLNYIQKHLNSKFLSSLKVKNSSLSTNATILGGISLVAQKFFNIQKLKFVQ